MDGSIMNHATMPIIDPERVWIISYHLSYPDKNKYRAMHFSNHLPVDSYRGTIKGIECLHLTPRTGSGLPGFWENFTQMQFIALSVCCCGLRMQSESIESLDQYGLDSMWDGARTTSSGQRGRFVGASFDEAPVDSILINF